jgi:hypothetical protein
MDRLAAAGRAAQRGDGVTPTFYLGTHQPGWLSGIEVPLFISDRRLRKYHRLPRALAPWALDSGGFTELSTHGTWSHGPTTAEYVDRIHRYQRFIGKLQWAAPQDWMCEPFITAKTGLTVEDHQWRTIDNLLKLRQLGGETPIIPVVQGYRVDDYVEHIRMYRSAGIDLAAEPLVGVGSVCRRQAETEAGAIFTALHAAGVTRLHGFGLKKLGLARFGHLLTSADSMAWSFDARRRQQHLPECQGAGHRNCANCPRYALRWRQQAIASLHSQPSLFEGAAA